MKLLVDEMPSYPYVCTFLEVIDLYRSVALVCKLTGNRCDLDCGTCSSLKLLETKE